MEGGLDQPLEVRFRPTKGSARESMLPVVPVVLVVDDESSVRELLRRWLDGWGYRVTEASRATEALEVMLAGPASIILCDIRMPGHDGFWLLERVRERWPETVIIMATGMDDIPTVVKSREARAVDYVVKPFGRELLRQALNRANAALAIGSSLIK